ncbi:hypothetical protein LUU34_00678900 [Aix galericulata]|nr:hypothetical protein LUU34_00678900 [Aix galericulata]
MSSTEPVVPAEHVPHHLEPRSQSPSNFSFLRALTKTMTSHEHQELQGAQCMSTASWAWGLQRSLDTPPPLDDHNDNPCLAHLLLGPQGLSAHANISIPAMGSSTQRYEENVIFCHQYGKAKQQATP